MKKSFLLLSALVAMVMFSCKENPYIAGPGTDDPGIPDTIPQVKDPEPSPDPAGVVIPEGCLNVYQACDTCAKLASGASTTEKYYVKGWISELDAKNTDGILSYGNATFYMKATSNGRGSRAFEAYQVYGKDGKKLTSVNQVAVGDFVIIYGQLMNFNGTAETVSKGAAYIYYSTNEYFDPKEDPTKITPDPEGADVPAGTLNVYEARHISDSIGSGKTTTEEYYIKGWVRRLDSKHESGVQQFGNGTFYIAATNDGTTDSFTFEAYQVYGKDKQKLTSADQVEVGDFVVIRGKITNYGGTAETPGKGAAYIYYSTNPKW